MLKLFDAYGNPVEIKQWKFPAGELGVKILGDYPNGVFTIECNYQSSDDLIYLLLLVDAIRNKYNNTVINLVIPYFPYARQDRVCASGESFSLKVIANLISSYKFNKVTVWDAHSSVLQAFFDSGVFVDVKQDEILTPYIKESIEANNSFGNVAIIAPDEGAIKKSEKIAKSLNCNMICFSKVRDTSRGDITNMRCSVDATELDKYHTLYVVDDIADNGGTFIALGKVIRNTYKGNLVLVVTHGNFGNGFEELNKYYNEIQWANPLVNRMENNG